MAALLEASGCGHHALVASLLESRVDPNGRGRSTPRSTPRFTPLHAAAAGGHADCVQLLLGRGASLRATAPNGAGAAFYAVLGRDANRAAGALEHTSRDASAPEHTSDSGVTHAGPTASSIAAGDSEGSSAVPPCTPCPCCGYPLYPAPTEGPKEGACVVCGWAQGETGASPVPLGRARRRFERCAASEDEVEAVSSVPQRVRCLRSLLAAGAPLRARDRNKQSLLHAAARAGSVACLRELRAHAASGGGALPPVDGRDRWHRTPVHWAVLNGHWGALRFLVALLGARVDPGLVRGYVHRRRTPTHKAAAPWQPRPQNPAPSTDTSTYI